MSDDFEWPEAVIDAVAGRIWNETCRLAGTLLTPAFPSEWKELKTRKGFHHETMVMITNLMAVTVLNETVDSVLRARMMVDQLVPKPQ